jgi:hypothetical protein
MWGSWFLITIGGTVGIVLLIGALALSAWSPIFAILAFIVVAIVLAVGAGLRRSDQYVEGAESDRGAPARGEGGPSGAQTLPPPTRP